MGTKKAFADVAGVYPSTVRRWITGESRVVSDENVDGLAKALGLDSLSMYELSTDRPAVMQPRAIYGTRTLYWAEFAKWVENATDPVKDAILAVAKSHGWEK